MKLLKSIPKKTIQILGRNYEVYEPVRHTPGSIRVHVGNETYQRYFRTLLAKKDPKNHLEKTHEKIKGLVDDTNRWVEQNYVGDRRRVAPEDTMVNVLPRGERIVIDFYYNDINKEKVQRKFFFLGNAEGITVDRMKYEVTRIGKIRKGLNKKYNEELAAKRAEFRKTVEKELAERDGSVL